MANFNNPMDSRTEAFRNEAKQRLSEAIRHSNLNYSVDALEEKIFKQTKTREEYVTLFKRVLQKAHQSAQQRAAVMNQDQRLQQQQQMQPQQQQQQQQQQQHQPMQQPQQQPQQQMNPMFAGNSTINPGQQQASAGSMFAKAQSNVQLQQSTNQTPVLPQSSPGQVISMRPSVQQKFSNSPMSRTMPGTAPSPQSSMVGSYQPRAQWTQPSPGNQFSSGGFAQPKPPAPTNTQPILTMPDSVGSQHPVAIPSLSPAHASPQVGTTSPSLRTPGSVQAAPSPSTLSIATVPSPAPANASQQADDDKEYMEKLKQLQKFIEPLSRMINKFNEGGEHNKELSKMKNLRDTLINPSKRLQFSTLEKCEKVLQSWLDQKPSQPPFPQSQPNQHMCQPILNVIATASKSPLLNHTLKRTFGPAMRTICGDYSTPEYLPNKRQCIRNKVKELERRKAKEVIPTVVKGEIARLNSKFNVKVQKNQSETGDIKILCFLNDPRLPSVPPLQISVPKSYPEDCPQWIKLPVFVPNDIGTNSLELTTMNKQGEKKDGFEKVLESILEDRMSSLNHSTSTISSLINAWEMSVRQACSAVA